MAEERHNLYLVDGSGYIFRAFFALPQLNNSRGLPTNAIYGFIRMLLKLLKDAHPSHIAMVFDSARKTFRDDLFDSYKANRPVTPNDLLAQIPYIHRAVAAFRIPSLVIDGYEADDVIGTLAVRAAKSRFNTVIVTGDKDFMQLAGPNITLWDTMRDKRIGAREVRERFGVDPRALVDIMALMGDAIDNVKGVPGVGEKTASALIQHFGGLEALFAGLGRLEETKIRGAKKLAGLLADHRNEIELARKLVRIDTEVPLTVEPEGLGWPGIDHQIAADLMRELEFGSLLAELAPPRAVIARAAASSETRVNASNFANVMEMLAKAPRLALNLGPAANGAGVDDNCGTSGNGGAGELKLSADTEAPRGGAAVASTGEVLKLKAAGGAESFVLGADLMARSAPLLGAPVPLKACHDLKSQLVRFRTYGVELAGVDFDTMLAGFLVNPGKAEPSLDSLYHEHLAPFGNAPAISEPEIIETLRETLGARLKDLELERLFNEIELPVARVLAAMEEAGIAVDAAALNTISREAAAQLGRLERECFELAGCEFNLNSPTQLRQVLFTGLKLSAKGLKKTKSGYSTDADALEKLAQTHPLPAKILEYRTIAKLKSTYSDALPALISPADGRVHTSFHQALTATGRLSSSEPNLQNIPTRSEEGRRIRRAFVPQPGFLLLSADYSQIELRVLAHLSGDPTLVEAFSRGEDIHTRTATEVLGAGAIDAAARR
ncbi:MAG: DNA polymerase I, partial [Candidatus Binataceae bacterium]